MNVHVDIPPFSAFVQTKFLYDMDESFEGQTEPCTVFAVSSYKGHYLTFKILLKNGALFDYIPAHALSVGTSKPVTELSLGDLCFYKACPDFHVTVSTHEVLMGAFNTRTSWFPNKNKWIEIERYICTVDWYKDNENAHLVVLANHQVAFIPNHKMLLLKRPLADYKLPPYKALKQEWKP
jgi:hypothetical protein